MCFNRALLAAQADSAPADTQNLSGELNPALMFDLLSDPMVNCLTGLVVKESTSRAADLGSIPWSQCAVTG